MMAKYTPKGQQTDKPQWATDYQRVLDGRPFTTEGWDNAKIERHTVPVKGPWPFDSFEVRDGVELMDGSVVDGVRMRVKPPQSQIYPSGPWHLLSVVDDASPRKTWRQWEHVVYTERCKMPEFKRKPDAEPPRNFQPARERKDLA